MVGGQAAPNSLNERSYQLAVSSKKFMKQFTRSTLSAFSMMFDVRAILTATAIEGRKSLGSLAPGAIVHEGK